MYSDWVWQIVLGAVFLWNVGLTVIVLRERGFLRQFFPKEGSRDIRKKFEEVLQEFTGFNLKLSNINKGLEELQKDGLDHIQKVSLLRYNPYDDTGGDQSFSVALLDHKGNGVVVTSLHTRAGTRVFAKSVKNSKAEKYEFSKEEKQVIIEALK